MIEQVGTGSKLEQIELVELDREEELKEEEVANDDGMVEIFYQMQLRKHERVLSGVYKHHKPWMGLWVLVLLLFVAGIAHAYVESGVISIKVSGGFFVVFFVMVVLYVVAKLVIVVRWMLYWLLFGIVLNLLATDKFTIFDEGTPTWLIYLMCFLEGLTVLLFVSMHYLYPWFIRSWFFVRYIGIERFWRIRRIQPFTVTYRDQYMFSRKSCTYRGETDKHGLPHGYGQWMDDSYNGELVSGLWHHGSPIAPFRAREYGSGFAFEAVQIAFVQLTDDPFSSNKAYGSVDGPFRCGVVSTECSVSGAFFSHLPQSRIIGSVRPLEGLCDMLASMKYLSRPTDKIKSRVEIVAKVDGGVSINGYFLPPEKERDCNQVVVNIERNTSSAESKRKSRTLVRSASLPFGSRMEKMSSRSMLSQFDSEQSDLPILKVQDWALASSQYTEALLFFPGFNAPLQSSCDRFGQFLTMSHLPKYIKPIIIDWPGGKVPTYYNVRTVANHPRITTGLKETILLLQKANIKGIHILTHSMGVQPLLGAFKAQENGEISEVAALLLGENPTMKCLSITLLNADYPLTAFIHRGFQTLRQVCSLITLVGNKKDSALFWAVISAHLLKNIVCKLPPKHMLGEGDFETSFKSLGREVSQLYRKDADDTKGVYRKEPNPLLREHQMREWLDLDVIDTTWVDTNVHKLRHNYFSLNPALIDDLHELFTTKQRAMHRSSLLHREGNVYSYTQAPSCVVNQD
mmetsp:Transcript_34282/g.54915  ORF Transcript_34282/g.54915 Transcript_34282/m.54915 type:complete len:742 (+) Transcript_34282:291-2516(+)